MCFSPDNYFCLILKLKQFLVQFSFIIAVRVWLEYTKFVTEMMEHLGDQEDALVRIRKVFEDALTSVGLHVMQVNKAWQSLRKDLEVVDFSVLLC